ncbi:hypothetical protein [Nocardia stercoris]|uniref:Uncharacterized protein n=1 Tax=Nocardia stercoris TaxID=2483361 RepID=A0A3M2LDD9_9NOCA|nr:hypothetical protein [Nocardia stercoris]RMI35557.1 hypothetical protein EBN03_04770 [Nocardia stercoris]
MAYGAPGQYPGGGANPDGAPRKPSTTDVVVAAVLLVVAWAGTLGAGVAGLFVFAFADYCPPETCSTDRAFGRLLVAAGVVGVLLVGGTAGVVVQGVRRRRAWPIAAIVLAGCVVGCVAGLVGAASALGFGSAS